MHRRRARIEYRKDERTGPTWINMKARDVNQSPKLVRRLDGDEAHRLWRDRHRLLGQQERKLARGDGERRVRVEQPLCVGVGRGLLEPGCDIDFPSDSQGYGVAIDEVLVRTVHKSIKP